jgi:hypothetical protein
MRNTRDKWVFFSHKSKPAISPEELVYWKRNLNKILKVGMEFEFNLPNETGKCKGKSFTCPCINMYSGENCWKQCSNKTVCQGEKINSCINKTDSCCSDLCEDCNMYDFNCVDIFCSSFSPACFSCNDFKTNCKDCKNKYDQDRNPDAIRSKVTSELRPSNTYGTINKSGVHSIVTDGSLLGKKGMEVITTGRRIDYWEFYHMSKRIIDESLRNGAYVNERCSIHMHLLASYYSKLVPEMDSNGIPNKISELEKDMPEIILANFHQLCRRYQNAITWMTMGLDDPDHMTRWEKFRVSIIDISAILNSMATVKREVEHTSGGNKYGWLNYKYTQFSKDNNINRLHIEFRVMDGILSPSIVAAVACLYYSLMIKAVEISRYGLLEVGDKEWMKQTKEVKKALLNNMKGYQDGDRFGYTENLHKYYDILATEAVELVRQLKHILTQIGPAYQILEQIAERPPAIRRCHGNSWEQIESELAIPVSSDTMFETAINEYIDLRLIHDCKNLEEWFVEISNAFRENPHNTVTEHMAIEEIKSKIFAYIEDKKDDGEIIWSKSLGTVVKVGLNS